MHNDAIKPEIIQREPPPGVHVILGDSAAGTFRQAFHARDRLFVDPDVLSCGPTPKCADLESWSRMRLEYWNETVDDAGEPGQGTTGRVLENLPRLREAGRVNIWFATSLSEQLFVAFTVQVLDEAGVDPGRVYLVPFEQLRDRPRVIVRGMGEVNPENMADHPEPVCLSRDVLDDYRAVWAALTSEDPRAFEQFASVRPNASSWLKTAMRLMLRRFPDRQSGLIHWEQVLLGVAREKGPRCVRIIGYALVHDDEDGDFVGDCWLFTRLLRMGDESLPRPLLKLSGSGPGMRETEVVLTDFGRDVLEGRASNHPANPIEDWAAGVKLSSSAGLLWFNDGGRLVRA